jgi:hypothetical protein
MARMIKRKLYKLLGIHRHVLSKTLIERWELPKYCATNGKRYKYQVHFNISEKYGEHNGKLLSRSVKVEIETGTEYIFHILWPDFVFYKNSSGSISRINAFSGQPRL